MWSSLSSGSTVLTNLVVLPLSRCSQQPMESFGRVPIRFMWRPKPRDLALGQGQRVIVALLRSASYRTSERSGDERSEIM